MRVLIFEPDVDGHRMHYVRNMVLGLRQFAQDVTLALTASAPASAQFRLHLGDLDGQYDLDAWMPELARGPAKYAAARVHALRRSVARVKPDWLYVPYADGVGQLLGLRRAMFLPNLPNDVPAEGLMLRGGFAYPLESRKRAIKARLAWAAACRARWRIMHVLDPLAYEPTIRRWPGHTHRIRLMPDPVEHHEASDRAAARLSLGIPVDGRYIGCAGVMDTRKGIDLLIRAFADSALDRNDRLLLAGQQDAPIQQLLAGPFKDLVNEGRIICLNYTLSVEQIQHAMTAMDVVCALYPRHIGSASIAIRAAAAQRPVLAHTFGWVGTIVPRFGLGWTCNALDLETLKAALSKSLEDARSFVPPEASRRFVDFHSVENFQACWTAEIRRHLGLPPAQGHRPWEWVLEVFG